MHIPDGILHHESISTGRYSAHSSSFGTRWMPGFKAMGCLVHKRPFDLTDGLSYRIDDVLLDFVNNSDEVAEYIHLVQCTSPFVSADHIYQGKAGFLWGLDNLIDSVQLVTRIDNAHHAFSQRRIREWGTIHFCYPHEREECFNSQKKPNRYAFAGYVAFATRSLQEHGNIWGKVSLPIVGDRNCGVDIDTPEDLEYAEYLIKRGQ